MRQNNQSKTALIYNPHAGTKRKVFPSRIPTVSLEDIKELLKQYQILVDYFPTKAPGHATQLAKNAAQKGYKLVLVAGGDGTVGEVANGLIGTEAILGIIPFGSFMNVARMLSIPAELEKAISVIKIGRTRKIDVGCVTKMGGEKLNQPYYFIESAGLGLEAELHGYFLELEQGKTGALLRIFKTLFEYYGRKATIILDQKEIQTRASVVTISNGPYMGAALEIAPKAKLNDHRLTVTLFRLSKWELFNYIFHLVRSKRKYSPKIVTYQAKKVQIKTKVKRVVHADARVFGTTPVEFNILPNALSVITGFPKQGDSALAKRTFLDY